ncbi:hypothetical protein GOM49_04365 [Clostridium bovifaecis]|uniref:Uncharacterized protein n=1 Tax=Clostridium bovifaecis TaxID=2184719 RepID=A0A6I6F113_9CLOT|nr:hypothetical protein GOM49_04365 [Clostridium bovifaecis]
MKKKSLILIPLMIIILIFLIIVNKGSSTKLVREELNNTQNNKSESILVESTPKEQKASMQEKKEEKPQLVNLDDKAILSLINSAQESFFKVTRGVKALDDRYGMLSEEFNSPEKLQKYLDLYWTKNAAEDIIKFIGAKYINNKYCIILGDASEFDILNGKILKKKQDKDTIYLTIRAYWFDEAENKNFELKFENNKWLVDYFEGSFGVIGESKEIKSTEVTPERAVQIVLELTADKSENTAAFDREEVRDGVKYYVIQVFDNMPTHTAARGWYFVNSKDGIVYEWDLASDKLNLIKKKK